MAHCPVYYCMGMHNSQMQIVVDGGHCSDGRPDAGHGALRNRLLIDDFDERRGRKRSALRINRAKYGLLAHDGFIGGERDERPARHGVMRHERSHASAR